MDPDEQNIDATADPLGAPTENVEGDRFNLGDPMRFLGPSVKVPDVIPFLGGTEINPFRQMVTNPWGAGAFAPNEPVTVDPAARMEPGEPSVAAKLLGKLSPNPPQQTGALPGDKKGKGGGLSGSVRVDVTPPIPGDLLAKQMAYAGQRADLQAAYQQSRAMALGIAVDIQKDFADEYGKIHEETSQQIEALLTEAEQEKEGIGELIEAARSQRINPGQFFANIGEAGKFSAALAVGAGAMATAFGGGPNVAYQIISSAIERNVRAQIVNQAHGRALIAHQTNFVNTIRGLSKDRAQYGNYLKIGLGALAQAEIGIVNTALQQAEAKFAGQDVYARLGAYVTEAQIKAITNSAARITMNFKSMAQYRQAMNALNVGRSQAAKAPSQGQKRPSLGAGAPTGKSPSARPPATTAGATTRKTATDSVSLAQKAIMNGGSADEIFDTYRAAIWERGEPVKSEDRQALLDQIDAIKTLADQKGDEGTSAALNAAKDKIRQKPAYAWDNTLRVVPISYGTSGTAYGKVIDEKAYNKADKKALGAALQAVYDYAELHELLRTNSISPNAPLLSDIGISDGSRSFSTFFTGKEAEQKAAVRDIATRLVSRYHASLNANTRNSMDRIWERRRAETGSGAGITMAEFVADMVREMPELQQARIQHPMRSIIADARNTFTAAGVYLEDLEIE